MNYKEWHLKSTKLAPGMHVTGVKQTIDNYCGSVEKDNPKIVTQSHCKLGLVPENYNMNRRYITNYEVE